MTPFPHHYEVHLADRVAGYGRLTSAGLPALLTAAPREFDGPGDAWTPEHLLLGSVQACFLLTFRAVAQHAKLPFTALDVSASGIVDRKDGVTRFTEITMRPKLILPAGTDHERALQVLRKSEKNCLVTASLSTAVRLEPEIVEEDVDEPVVA